MMDLKNEQKSKLMIEISKHIGLERAIGADELFEKVFGEPVTHKINGTRMLRKMITDLRREGVPIASVSNPGGGGYYMASVGSELEGYLATLINRGLHSLDLAAKIKNQSLPQLMGQLRLNYEGSVDGQNNG